MTPTVAFAVLALALSAGLAAAQDPGEIKITGRVIGPSGAPIAGARLGTAWSFDNGRMRPYGTNVGRPVHEDASLLSIGRFVTTDANGEFAGYFPIDRDFVRLTVFSKDDQLGGSFAWAKGTPIEGVTLKLQPTARVRGRWICSRLQITKANGTAYLYSLPDRQCMGSFDARSGGIDVRLPVGTYEFYLYGKDVAPLRRPITVRADQRDVDLGDIDLPAEVFALLHGKVLPEWHVTAARGVPIERATLANYRGKWLLVEFWGFW